LAIKRKEELQKRRAAKVRLGVIVHRFFYGHSHSLLLLMILTLFSFVFFHDHTTMVNKEQTATTKPQHLKKGSNPN
jgi:hypothetical protein